MKMEVPWLDTLTERLNAFLKAITALAKALIENECDFDVEIDLQQHRHKTLIGEDITILRLICKYELVEECGLGLGDLTEWHDQVKSLLTGASVYLEKFSISITEKAILVIARISLK